MIVGWVLGAYSTVSAGEYQTNLSFIHKITIDVGGQCCSNFGISTKVGYFKNHVCIYEQETPRTEVNACEVYPFGVFQLDGDALTRIIGNRWTCAETHVHEKGLQDQFDEFQLVKNKQGRYIDSKPKEGKIFFPVCAPQ